MRIIGKLKGMEPKELATLEANARRLVESGGLKQRSEAESLLTAIKDERNRRIAEENKRRRSAKEEVKEKVKDLGLFDRAVRAFEELPLKDNEVAVLKAIAEYPGKDFHFLATMLGKRDGGYLNLAVGTICAEREPYLGKAPPPLRPGPSDKVYSALIIDFTRHKGPDGSEWHGWTLKPEVKAALEHLGII